MSQNKQEIRRNNTYQLSLLEAQIAENKKLLSELKPPARKGRGAQMLYENTADTNTEKAKEHLIDEQDYGEKLNLLATMIENVDILRRKFDHEAQLMLTERYTDQQREAFASATRRYHKALEALNNCHSNMAGSFKKESYLSKPLEWKKTAEDIQHLNTADEELKTGITNFSKKLTQVTAIIAEHQLRHMEENENGTVILKEIIPHIKEVYEKAYDEDHWSLAKFFKKLFQKSDRAQEIQFLNEISQKPGCTDFIRAQAVSLVYQKIDATEFFGAEGFIFGGSKLGKMLGKVLKNVTIEEDKYAQENLIQFMKDNEIEMPKSLRAYTQEQEIQDEYSQNAKTWNRSHK